MNDFLSVTVVILSFVVLLGFFNEKVTRFTHEIALMLFSTAIGACLLLLGVILRGTPAADILGKLQIVNIEAFLMEGVLCFMLFAGSCHMRLLDFRKHIRAVSLLAFGATLLSAVFYGLLFYGVGLLLGLDLSIPVCLMFGSIIAPTDPIAATSILKKFKLPPNISFIIEGESLLNDGVGVALFVCFSGLVSAEESGGFFSVMIKELFGAILVGVLVTAVCYPLFKRTKDTFRRIFTSLLAVSLAYVLCEAFGFSGAIASVVCGVLFSALRNWSEHRGEPMALREFDVFWEILDNLLNSILYVILGLSFLQILRMEHVLLISAAAVIINLVSRSGSLAVSTLFMGPLPDRYDRRSFVGLLTWGGLRGGLSVALAMSAHGLVPDAIYYILLGGTYAVVFFTTIVQGMTMPGVYRKIEAGIPKQ